MNRNNTNGKSLSWRRKTELRIQSRISFKLQGLLSNGKGKNDE